MHSGNLLVTKGRRVTIFLESIDMNWLNQIYSNKHDLKMIEASWTKTVLSLAVLTVNLGVYKGSLDFAGHKWCIFLSDCSRALFESWVSTFDLFVNFSDVDIPAWATANGQCQCLRMIAYDSSMSHEQFKLLRSLIFGLVWHIPIWCFLCGRAALIEINLKAAIIL